MADHEKVHYEKLIDSVPNISGLLYRFCRNNVHYLLQIIAKDLPEVVNTMREMGEKVRNWLKFKFNLIFPF